GEYYAKLDEASEPQKLTGKGAFQTCLAYSVKYQYFDEYSRRCEEWLSKNFGAEYHLIDEFRGAASRVNSGLSDAPAPLNLDGTTFHVDAPPPPDAAKDDKGAAAAPADKGDAGGDKPGVSKEKSALDKAKLKKK
ncbi:MAG: hypothetical protein ABI134_18435, partial [Byssovorax sp.]